MPGYLKALQSLMRFHFQTNTAESKPFRIVLHNVAYISTKIGFNSILKPVGSPTLGAKMLLVFPFTYVT
jgi:hypothetical protein